MSKLSIKIDWHEPIEHISYVFNCISCTKTLLFSVGVSEFMFYEVVQ